MSHATPAAGLDKTHLMGAQRIIKRGPRKGLSQVSSSGQGSALGHCRKLQPCKLYLLRTLICADARTGPRPTGDMPPTARWLLRALAYNMALMFAPVPFPAKRVWLYGPLAQIPGSSVTRATALVIGRPSAVRSLLEFFQLALPKSDQPGG
jgi:hypothetical protein